MSIDKQIAVIDAQIEELKEQREQVQRKRMVACRHCKKRTRIDKLTFVQKHYYVPPYGCTGGDYYMPDGGAFDCPSCDKRNRIVENPDEYDLKHYAHPKSQVLYAARQYFKEIVDEYPDRR